jgi:hypothetical protein
VFEKKGKESGEGGEEKLDNFLHSFSVAASKQQKKTPKKEKAKQHFSRTSCFDIFYGSIAFHSNI